MRKFHAPIAALVACTTTFPSRPTNLAVTAPAPDRIEVTWLDNSNNEEGFLVEYREGQTGLFAVIDTVGSGETTYIDQSVSPTTEYCYRVAALAGGKSSFSTVVCTTTPPVSAVNCTTDPKDNRSILADLLTDPDPSIASWRSEVGLSNADPSQLVLVTDDSICQTLYAVSSRSNPEPGELIAFFKLGDKYIVTNYVNADPSYGPVVMGYNFTSVVDEQFNFVNPHLAH